MPATKLQQRARTKYITVQEFQNQYSLSKAQAYKILKMPEFEEVKIKIGQKGIRLDLDRTFEIMQMLFSWKERKQMKKTLQGFMFLTIVIGFVLGMIAIAEILSKLITMEMIMTVVYIALGYGITYILKY